MKQFFMLVLMIVSVTAVYAQKAKQGNPGKGHTITTIYTCPMHHNVQADKPGKCPECGMQLVKRKTSTNSASTKK